MTETSGGNPTPREGANFPKVVFALPRTSVNSTG